MTDHQGNEMTDPITKEIKCREKSSVDLNEDESFELIACKEMEVRTQGKRLSDISKAFQATFNQQKESRT